MREPDTQTDDTSTPDEPEARENDPNRMREAVRNLGLRAAQ